MSKSGDDTTRKEETALNKVGVRVPPFWPDDPALWFAQLEGQFVLAGITADATKCYYATAQLEHRYAVEVKDIIQDPPKDGKYNKLKNELVKRLTASQEKRIQQLLAHEELGNRKPSQFLRHLQTLAGPTVTSEFLRTLWAGRLPTHIETVVATQRRLSLEEVADLADTVYDIVSTTPQVATMRPTYTNNTIMELSKQAANLTRQVALENEIFYHVRTPGHAWEINGASQDPSHMMNHRYVVSSQIWNV